MLRIWWLATAALCVLFSTLAGAATIRVPTDQATIQAAINAAQPGDIISVDNSATYAENPTIGSAAASPLTIRATATPPAIVNGYFNWNAAGKVTVIEGLAISNGTYGLMLDADSLRVACTNLRIRNASSAGVRFTAKTNGVLNLTGCAIENSGSGYGVYLSAGCRANLISCVVAINGTAIYLDGGNSNTLSLLNCTIMDDNNNASAVMLMSSVATVCVTNCIIYQGQWGVFRGTGNYYGDYNIVYGQGLSAMNNAPIGPHDMIDSTAGMESPSSHNFHLKSSSPAIDAGADLSGAAPIDCDGNARPAGRGYDIGAFEYGSVPPRVEGISIFIY